MGLGADRGWSESHSLTSCGWVAGTSTSKVTMVAASNSPDAHHQGDRAWRVTTVAPGCFMSRVLLFASSSFIHRCLIWNVSSVRPLCIWVLRLNAPMTSSQVHFPPQGQRKSGLCLTFGFGGCPAALL